MIAALPLAGLLSEHASAGAKPAIQLHVDLETDPAREEEMVGNFHSVFRPAIRKQPGFVDVKLLKLRGTVAGKSASNSTHRLLISFETEEQRLKWVASAAHQAAWPAIEKCLKGAKYTAALYDVVT